MKVLAIDRSTVERLVTMKEAIEAMRSAFVQLSTGKAIVPVRLPLRIEDQSGVVLFMPGYLARSRQVAAKVVSVFPNNPQRGLPTINAAILTFDAETGQLTAIMDGSYITALRTGAGSGLATELLSRPESRSVAIIGAGVQARTQLWAVCEVRRIERAFIFSRTRSTAEAMAKEMAGFKGAVPSDLVVTQSAEEAVSQADVVCTATTSSQPVFKGQAVRPGTHVNGVGSFTREMREVDDEFIRRARIYVDSLEACLQEAGDIIQPLEAGLIQTSDIVGEIGQVAAGLKPGRTDPQEITFFKSVGNAVQDVAVAHLVLQRALEVGAGSTIEL
jgi:alanine dehydrogenase